MNTESPRFRALLAGAAALVVFGITVPATANNGVPGPPPVGSVGNADEKANPPGQTAGDHNKGFTCDENKGAGVAGNPALPNDCGSGGDSGSSPGNSGGNNGNGPGSNSGGGGRPAPDEPWVPVSG